MEKLNEKNCELSTKILLSECSNERKLKEDIFFDISLATRGLIHEIFRYQKFNYDFCDNLACYNNGNYVVGYIRPSYNNFLESVCKFLNYQLPEDYQDNDELTKKLLERLDLLKNIKNMKDLKVNFPYIYDDIIAGRKYMKNIEELEKKEENDNNKYEQAKKYFYSCALKRNLDSFIKSQTLLYERLINRRFDYKKLIESKDYNNYFEKYFDINKVALYTIYEYIKICENTNNHTIINKYLKLIEKYIDSDYDKSVSIKINNEVIDINYLKVKIFYIKEKLKSTESETEWVLVPRSYKKVTKSNNIKQRTTLFNYSDLARIREKGERKRTFYENSPYLLRVKGSTSYKGYTGYIYPNGEVILDVDYDELRPSSTAVGDAIYNIKAVDFENLSRLDKKTLKNNPKVTCIIHSKYWERKVEEIISKKNTQQDEQAAKQLVKKLKKE